MLRPGPGRSRMSSVQKASKGCLSTSRKVFHPPPSLLSLATKKALGQKQSQMVSRDEISSLCLRNYGEVTGREIGDSLPGC